MRVNSTFTQPQNPFLKVSGTNKSFHKDRYAINNAPNGKSNKDKVSISPQGKMMNRIENLIKQKEFIVEKKNELISKTLESGSKMDTIKGQLDTYTEKLADIDKQIADIYAQQLKETTEKQEKKSNKSSGNKTKEQFETEKLSKLANATTDIKNAEIVSSTKSKIEGEVRIEKSEIKIAETHIDILDHKTVNVRYMVANAKSALHEKRKIASNLQDKALNLDLKQGENLGDVIRTLENNNINNDNPKEVDSPDPTEK